MNVRILPVDPYPVDPPVIVYICFAAGTGIATPGGEVAVERLRPGALVETLDHGPRPVRWCAARRLSFPPSPARQKPIEFKPGSLGPGRPVRPLTVSPQHRMLVATAAGERLAAAVTLEALPGVRRKRGCRAVTYVTVMFDAHEVIFAEGAPVESFYPAAGGVAVLAPADRLRLIAAAPGLSSGVAAGFGPPARPILPNRAARDLAAARELRFAAPGQAGWPIQRSRPVPTASARLANPSRAMSASSPRAIRAASDRPS